MNNSLQVSQNGINLLRQSGYHKLNDIAPGRDLSDDMAIVRPVHIGSMLCSYLIGERDTYHNVAKETLNSFKRELIGTFNDDELQELCSELDIPFTNLGKNTHNGRIRALIEYGQRHGRLADLVAYCRRERPHVAWPHFPVVDTPAVKSKSDLAIVISINQPALEHAASHLAAIQVDCNFVLLTTTPDYANSQWLPHNTDWQPAVQDFYQTMQHNAVRIPRLRRHFFFATPLPYAFAIGCAWGLVHQGDELYHWAGSSYVRVLTSTREWRNRSDDSA